MYISYLQPESDSDGTNLSLPSVGLTVPQVETSHEGHSVLLPGGVFARSPANGLQVHFSFYTCSQTLMLDTIYAITSLYTRTAKLTKSDKFEYA